jgi:hypothetical protein
VYRLANNDDVAGGQLVSVLIPAPTPVAPLGLVFKHHERPPERNAPFQDDNGPHARHQVVGWTETAPSYWRRSRPVAGRIDRSAVFGLGLCSSRSERQRQGSASVRGSGDQSDTTTENRTPDIKRQRLRWSKIQWTEALSCRSTHYLKSNGRIALNAWTITLGRSWPVEAPGRSLLSTKLGNNCE